MKAILSKPCCKVGLLMMSLLCFLLHSTTYGKHSDNNLSSKGPTDYSYNTSNATLKTLLYQSERTVTGQVTSADGSEGIPGVTVLLKGTGRGTTTDIDGKYSIKINSNEAVLLFSFVGFATQEVPVNARSQINVSLKEDITSLEEVVIIGYGEQKKESVVAAITQTDSKALERTGGVSSVGAALTGNVPGVITTASTGMPGEEDPLIYIRGVSTMNNATPLILVDGVERPMSSVAISSIESISVLKDASATAVYGVRGANGVILITTKRGKEGKATIRARVNSTVKVPSKLPGKYDAYDALKVRNEVIEYELAMSPSSWNEYLPQAIIDKYRNPANQEEMERYPNVDWANTLFKDYAMSYNASLNISGGTEFVKYFAGADFQREGDLFRQFDNNRGYDPGYGFNRLNVRSNLDFQLTNSTKLSVGLAGSYGVKKEPVGGDRSRIWYVDRSL
ncbi:SusC/RagA family TonB-linked outer membrane protein [Fulvivirga ligni]|uniref:SusC/RagA family TonB-linked outer membrane protein n=1 Tax=Fulvivirga ligni TaxID=2904246 RepID=UPI001F2BD7BA|nr:SusC/RagA family TonB-linked outer membrane protein [Fulvivirga ligni]UII19590.1 SusC/RagA family TonB-linked outer membrane protein [Fulvivirga ligni]